MSGDFKADNSARLWLSIFAELQCTPGEIMLSGSVFDMGKERKISVTHLAVGIPRAIENGWIERFDGGQLQLTEIGYQQMTTNC